MAIGGINIGQELLNVPMGDMIRSMALAIAEAQWELDKSSIRVAELMSGSSPVRDLNTGVMSVDAAGRPQILDSRVFFGYVYDVDQNNVPRRAPLKVSMMELGFTPNFYQFVDTIIEVKISITVTGTTESTSAYSSGNTSTVNSDEETKSSSYHTYHWWWGWGYNGSGRNTVENTQRTSVSTSQVNGAYTSKYGYSAEGSSLLRTKLVPIPPPAILEERIREVMHIERAYEHWKLLASLKTSLEAKAPTPEVTAEIKRVSELIDDALLQFALPEKGKLLKKAAAVPAATQSS